jgi:hypothetical protein
MAHAEATLARDNSLMACAAASRAADTEVLEILSRSTTPCEFKTEESWSTEMVGGAKNARTIQAVDSLPAILTFGGRPNQRNALQMEWQGGLGNWRRDPEHQINDATPEATPHVIPKRFTQQVDEGVGNSNLLITVLLGGMPTMRSPTATPILLYIGDQWTGHAGWGRCQPHAKQLPVPRGSSPILSSARWNPSVASARSCVGEGKSPFECRNDTSMLSVPTLLCTGSGSRIAARAPAILHPQTLFRLRCPS